MSVDRYVTFVLLVIYEKLDTCLFSEKMLTELKFHLSFPLQVILRNLTDLYMNVLTLLL